jgi:sec-independent protein translocase protein TatA
MLTGHLPEVIIILVVALIFLGPKRLPEAGSSIGKAIREFRHETQKDADDPSDREDVQPAAPRRLESAPDAQQSEAQPVSSSVHSSVDGELPEDEPQT